MEVCCRGGGRVVRLCRGVAGKTQPGWPFPHCSPSDLLLLASFGPARPRFLSGMLDNFIGCGQALTYECLLRKLLLWVLGIVDGCLVAFLENLTSPQKANTRLFEANLKARGTQTISHGVECTHVNVPVKNQPRGSKESTICGWTEGLLFLHFAFLPVRVKSNHPLPYLVLSFFFSPLLAPFQTFVLFHLS